VFDLETAGLDPHAGYVVSAQITCEIGKGYYAPMRHIGYEGNLDPIEVMQALHSLLEDPDVVVIAHNIKFDYQWFLKDGLITINNVWDTMVAAHVINENRPAYNLKFLTRDILEYDMITFKSLGIWTKEGPCPEGLYPHFGHLPLEEALPYACADVDMALRLYLTFKPIIDHGYKIIFYEVEMPLRAVLARMEFQGVTLDVEYMKRIGSHLSTEITKLHDYLNSTVNSLNASAFDTVLEQLNVDNWYKKLSKDGTRKKKKGFIEAFDWGNTTHLRSLFKLIGVHTGKYTPGSRKKKLADKVMSTDKKALLGLARKKKKGSKIAKALMGHRQLKKIFESFCETLPLKVNSVTGRIHPSFNQTRVRTGRLSCTEPNMQQIPKSGVCAIRYPFKPRGGYVFLQCDYSQVELRILAHMANDLNMIQAFADGTDIHSQTALECFEGKGIPRGTKVADIKEQYPKFRTAAKTINFGIVYGMGAKALAENLNVTLEEAQGYINSYLAAKPAVKTYMILREREMDDLGYVETPLGRRRHIRKGADGRRPFGWERQAINFPIQSASAEVLKVVMAVLQAKLDAAGYDARLILQIHDELIVECKEELADEVLPIIKETFEAAIEHLGVNYIVKLDADPTVQYRWNIEADKCPTCGRYAMCEDGTPDHGKSCMVCTDVRFPGEWDLEDTIRVIEEKAITNPTD
jgi:DNA polymerase-1